ncbi:MAG: glutamine--fructose-6-phosphate transaminase (isomerizing) [bacterium]|nr:glutamine--fructose-6-phosphate transaminase (isomerizing) [bacterium]
MCGIVGYIGPRDITSVLLVGLERLSYRGYDSSGIAVITDGELGCWKKEGKIHELSEEIKSLTIKGNVGIGHTRWATHGVPNTINAHPHLDTGSSIAVVHNGIIENYLSLKKKIKAAGYIMRSQTDSEVIVHLIDMYYKGDLAQAVRMAMTELEGSFGLSVICENEPDKIVVCRKDSPLILGLGKGENFVSSDINAIVTHTRDMVFLEDGHMAIVTQDDVTLTDFEGKAVEMKVEQVTWNAEASEKSGFDHFMLKEIHEQPTVVRRIIDKHVSVDGALQFNHLEEAMKDLTKSMRFIIQACGTSWHAGLIGKYLWEEYAHVPTEVDISSEFRYRQMLSGSDEFVVAISQSGETADTLACIREAKSKFFKILSFVNVKGSSIDRESDAVVYTHSGPEIGVASTKNYIAQLLNVYLFGLYLGQLKGHLSKADVIKKVAQVKRLPGQLEKILDQAPTFKAIAEKYYKSREFIFIGRGLNYPTALEGALKLKEISYIHATGYPAGELKHGPIALIDEKLPVVCLAPNSVTYEKMISNIEEVRARGGRIIIVATEGNEAVKDLAEDVIYIPECDEEFSPILSVVPLQLLSYYIAIMLECDVDQPRNLAKSVTVE